jgi:signal transduction histidine kinase
VPRPDQTYTQAPQVSAARWRPTVRGAKTTHTSAKIDLVSQSSQSDRAHLKVAPDLLVRLGEELVPHLDVGISELARNAWDADATECIVVLEDVAIPGGTITVADNGDGMDLTQIRDSWLLLGSSSKRSQDVSARLARYIVGEKGLGRLAALRAGSSTVMRTRPRSSPGVEHTVLIDWSDFDDAHALEDVALEIRSSPTDADPGTSIEIRNLHGKFTKRDARRLARSLLLLSDPFAGPSGFKVRLDAPEFNEFATLLETAYFDDAEYIVQASWDLESGLRADLLDSDGRRIEAAKHPDLIREPPEEPFACPPFQFELWAFSLDSPSFKARGSATAVSEVRDWLREVGGVHLYHRGLRVAPYGDQDVDWLELNLRRVRSPELRPSTNTSIGRVNVPDDPRRRLIAKTDRSGLIDNQAFEDLKNLCGAVLEWTARVRVQQRESRRRRNQRETTDQVESAKAGLEKQLDDVPEGQRNDIEAAVEDYAGAVEAKVDALQDELLLYRTMSTVGATTAVLAHEILRPIDVITGLAKSIRTRARRSLGEDKYDANLREPIDLLLEAANSLHTYGQLPLRLLAKSKRRPQTVELHSVIDDVLSLLGPSLDLAGVEVHRHFSSREAPIRSSIAALESVVANLLVNSVYFLVHGSTAERREIHIETKTSSEDVTLEVADNGPGIASDLKVDDAWLPGETRRRGGTGLGLTIVKDIIEGMGGTVAARRRGNRGGATFTIVLPLVSK